MNAGAVSEVVSVTINSTLVVVEVSHQQAATLCQLALANVPSELTRHAYRFDLEDFRTFAKQKLHDHDAIRPAS